MSGLGQHSARTAESDRRRIGMDLWMQVVGDGDMMACIDKPTYQAGTDEADVFLGH